MADTALLDELIAEVTVGETYFFRDAAQFEQLRAEIIPELRRLHGAEHIIRAWSAGCATGEEPYSLAILFEEMGLADSRLGVIPAELAWQNGAVGWNVLVVRYGRRITQKAPAPKIALFRSSSPTSPATASQFATS